MLKTNNRNIDALLGKVGRICVEGAPFSKRARLSDHLFLTPSFSAKMLKYVNALLLRNIGALKEIKDSIHI